MWTFVMNHSAETGLVLFLVCFAAITLFAATRTSRQLESWAKLPLGSNGTDDPREEETR